MTRIGSRIELATELERLEPSLTRVGLDLAPDVAITLDTPDTYNLANQPSIVRSIARVLSYVRTASSSSTKLVLTLFTNLTQESTARGYLAQIQGYEWLIAQGAEFEPEVAHSATLRGSTIDLDGRFNGLGRPVFFDIKSFGFEPDLRSIFVRRLEEKISGYSITIDGSGNHGLDIVTKEAFAKLRHYVAALSTDDSVAIPALGWKIRKHKKGPGLRLSESEYDPAALARENRWVPLHYASQFVTDAPFILIFVLPDGLGSSPLKTNVFSGLSEVGRGIAEYLFGTAATHASAAAVHDGSLSADVSIAQAVSRLSGIAFISPQANFAALHLNAQAVQPLSRRKAKRIARGWKIVVHGAVWRRWLSKLSQRWL